MKFPQFKDIAVEWAVYASRYQRANGKHVTSDPALGAHWLLIGEGIRGLLANTPQELTPGLRAFVEREFAEFAPRAD